MSTRPKGLLETVSQRTETVRMEQTQQRDDKLNFDVILNEKADVDDAVLEVLRNSNAPQSGFNR